MILACGAGNPTGNILNDIQSATADGDNVSVGQQTVPMKVTGFVAEPAIDIEKTCPRPRRSVRRSRSSSRSSTTATSR